MKTFEQYLLDLHFQQSIKCLHIVFHFIFTELLNDMITALFIHIKSFLFDCG